VTISTDENGNLRRTTVNNSRAASPPQFTENMRPSVNDLRGMRVMDLFGNNEMPSLFASRRIQTPRMSRMFVNFSDLFGREEEE